MMTCRIAAAAILLAALLTDGPCAGAETIAIAEFSYLDSSGEPGDQAAAHRDRIASFMNALARDVNGQGGRHAVALNGGQAPAALLRAADEAGAGLLIIGGVHKMSTLVEWAQAQVVDLAADRVIFDRLFTFRGDNDEAWARAETFMARDILAALPVAAAAPARLAVFDVELEDVSAGGQPDLSPADRDLLDKVGAGIRQLLAQSGRYLPVEAGAAGQPDARDHSPRACAGCAAAIARRLGADQSFVAVIRRISRTEYMVRFQVRDARSGAILIDANSGLRLGADYSWNRGALRLVRERLLEPSRE